MSCSFMRSVFASYVGPEIEADFGIAAGGLGVLSNDDCGIGGSRKGGIGTGTGGGGGEGSSRGSR